MKPNVLIRINSAQKARTPRECGASGGDGMPKFEDMTLAGSKYKTGKQAFSVSPRPPKRIVKTKKKMEFRVPVTFIPMQNPASKQESNTASLANQIKKKNATGFFGLTNTGLGGRWLEKSVRFCFIF